MDEHEQLRNKVSSTGLDEGVTSPEKRLRDATELLIENAKDPYLLPLFREAEKEWDEALEALKKSLSNESALERHGRNFGIMLG